MRAVRSTRARPPAPAFRRLLCQVAVSGRDEPLDQIHDVLPKFRFVPAGELLRVFADARLRMPPISITHLRVPRPGVRAGRMRAQGFCSEAAAASARLMVSKSVTPPTSAMASAIDVSADASSPGSSRSSARLQSASPVETDHQTEFVVTIGKTHQISCPRATVRRTAEPDRETGVALPAKRPRARSRSPMKPWSSGSTSARARRQDGSPTRSSISSPRRPLRINRTAARPACAGSVRHGFHRRNTAVDGDICGRAGHEVRVRCAW